MNLVTSVFPFVRWFKSYTLSNLRADFVAGLTVALVLVPQSMAYAQLAGLPAYYGLYAAFLPPMVAALFGSSRQLATGPVAVVSLMTATALEPLATAGSESFIAYAILLAEFLLSGRFRSVSRKIGIDVTMRFHQLLARSAVVLALLHPLAYTNPAMGIDPFRHDVSSLGPCDDDPALAVAAKIVEERRLGTPGNLDAVLGPFRSHGSGQSESRGQEDGAENEGKRTRSAEHGRPPGWRPLVAGTTRWSGCGR